MDNQGYRKLTKAEERVIVDKGTEMPFSGEYNDFFKEGTYHCKRCDTPLYNSTDKFVSSCGWPSFDDEIQGAIKRKIDADGRRTEILCANCDAHLGHVFEGEQLTDKNVRHCVNSISMVFKPNDVEQNFAKAYFAGGCFWGVEYHFENKKGVISAVSGYMGGKKKKPTYQDVSYGNSGHLEVVEVTYDPEIVSYKELAMLFFEIHDPTQLYRQGPDIGEQYSSAVFVNDTNEKAIIEDLVDILKEKGYDVVTKITDAEVFWEAEEYHQDYYEKHNKKPYCHWYVKRF